MIRQMTLTKLDGLYLKAQDNIVFVCIRCLMCLGK